MCGNETVNYWPLRKLGTFDRQLKATKATNFFLSMSQSMWTSASVYYKQRFYIDLILYSFSQPHCLVISLVIIPLIYDY